MMEMMQECWNWMMGLGAFGVVLGLLILSLLVVLLVLGIRKLTRGSPPA